MRRVFVAALFVGALGGCALVSGLSSLDVVPTCSGSACDGGSSAADASDGKPPGDGGTTEGSTGDAAMPEAAPPGVACGSSTCTAGTSCCVADAGATCSATACAGGTKTVACDDQTDCPGMVCCLANNQTQCVTTCVGETVCDPGASTNQCPSPKKCIETTSSLGITLHNCD